MWSKENFKQSYRLGVLYKISGLDHLSSSVSAINRTDSEIAGKIFLICFRRERNNFFVFKKYKTIIILI